MRAAFWVREEFLLMNGAIASRIEGQPANLLSASASETKARAKQLGMSKTALLAQDSSILWDGSQNLNDKIASDYLGSSTTAFPVCNFPACVRVLYTPKDENCPKFRDFMNKPLCLHDAVGTLKRLHNEHYLSVPLEKAVSYRLIVVVRLRSSREDGCHEDSARVYKPNDESFKPDWTDDNPWELGMYGYSYIL